MALDRPACLGTLSCSSLEVLSMPAPRWLARSNRHVLNPVLGRLAPHLPGFGIIIHTGRKSGRQYRTPVNVFKREGGYVVALTYGRESEWVRNVLAAGGCQLLTRGRTIQLSGPRLYHDEQRRAVPAPVRFFLGLLHVNDFLELSRDGR
jgi:deazaflavin-dependent oxidoreductase (nitroreductase family)